MSSYLGCSFTGIELREAQADFNQGRANEFGLSAKYICDDGRNVAKHISEESQDFFFSCPPYFDMEKYSDKENDASNQKTYEDFYRILDDAFSASARCLKKDRFAVVVCQDVRGKGGAYYNFPNDIIGTFTRNGFSLYNRLVLIRTVGTASLFAARSFNNYREVRTTHEDVLVFFNGSDDHIFTEADGDLLNDLYAEFLKCHQNINVSDDVLVFYKGQQGKIGSEFGPVERKEEKQ